MLTLAAGYPDGVHNLYPAGSAPGGKNNLVPGCGTGPRKIGFLGPGRQFRNGRRVKL